MTIAVVGGGAAGLMAAGFAAQNGAKVTLFESNPKVGRKIYITGKGRCNVTNNSDVQTVLANIPVNPRFLYAALGKCSPKDVMDFFEAQGVALKTERGNRVFPESDHATDIIDALLRFVRAQGVKIVFESVIDIQTTQTEDGTQIAGLQTKSCKYDFDRVILATGGASYTATGSTGDGYRFAKELGHTIVTPRPSLIPLVETGNTCEKLMGLSLKNVQISVFENNKKIYTEFGEMLFTHYGLSGPLVLSASSHMRHFGSKDYRVDIDLKPALDEATLNKRVLSDFEKYKNNDIGNALSDLLPRKIIPVILYASGIDPHTKVHSITKEQRRDFVQKLKNFSIAISGARPINEAIITTGGVSVKEVNPKTMASKKVDGLYFAGELLDVDAYTGGFNLQIAWATGKLAGESAAANVMNNE